jgi:hypothetical protein
MQTKQARPHSRSGFFVCAVLTATSLRNYNMRRHVAAPANLCAQRKVKGAKPGRSHNARSSLRRTLTCASRRLCGSQTRSSSGPEEHARRIRTRTFLRCWPRYWSRPQGGSEQARVPYQTNWPPARSIGCGQSIPILISDNPQRAHAVSR